MKPLAPATPIEVWFQDEMRVGQKNGLVYQWAKKGTRPRISSWNHTSIGVAGASGFKASATVAGKFF